MLRFKVRSLAVVFLASALNLAAQVRIVGDISGTVTDASGAGVPNAKVILKDSGTGNVRETSSNTGGQFSFPDLSFGKFEVSVSAAGFQTTVIPNVTVEASKTTNLAVALQVGQQTQSVTVEASATPPLEITSQLSSDSKEFKQINELPVLSRSALNVARL